MIEPKSSTFEEWILIARAANKGSLQLLSYALMILKKQHEEWGRSQQYEVSFRVAEYSRFCGKSTDYISAKKALVEINQLVQDTQVTFIQNSYYDDQNKKCIFIFNDGADFFLEHTHNRLISYRRLKESLYLKTATAIRLYNFLAKWRYEKSTSQISINELREVLGIEEGSYKRFERFRSCVIDNCIEEINHYTRLKIGYELKNDGNRKKVLAIRFVAANKTF